MSYEIENTITSAKTWLWLNRRSLFWCVVIVMTLWLLVAMKEVSTLLFLSYVIALLLDPLVTKLERRGLSRGTAVIIPGACATILLFLFLLIAIPIVLKEYASLVAALPDYLANLAEKLNALSMRYFNRPLPLDATRVVNSFKQWGGSLGGEQLRAGLQAVGQALLQGYSVTLTLLNLFLLPFFIFYIARDLRAIHRFIGKFIRDDIEVHIKRVGEEILEHVYAFFRGQITVSLIMAALYMLLLSLAGMPSALVVGFLAGVFNVIPYVGVALGLVLSTVITLVSDPSFSQLFLVWGAFGVVQFLEGFVLTPKFVGGSVGLHPLAAMLALIVGGQLFGLLGLIIAIPGAAALVVLFKELRRAVEEQPVPSV